MNLVRYSGKEIRTAFPHLQPGARVRKKADDRSAWQTIHFTDTIGRIRR